MLHKVNKTFDRKYLCTDPTLRRATFHTEDTASITKLRALIIAQIPIFHSSMYLRYPSSNGLVQSSFMPQLRVLATSLESTPNRGRIDRKGRRLSAWNRQKMALHPSSLTRNIMDRLVSLVLWSSKTARGIACMEPDKDMAVLNGFFKSLNPSIASALIVEIFPATQPLNIRIR